MTEVSLSKKGGVTDSSARRVYGDRPSGGGAHLLHGAHRGQPLPAAAENLSPHPTGGGVGALRDGHPGGGAAPGGGKSQKATTERSLFFVSA